MESQIKVQITHLPARRAPNAFADSSSRRDCFSLMQKIARALKGSIYDIEDSPKHKFRTTVFEMQMKAHFLLDQSQSQKESLSSR